MLYLRSIPNKLLGVLYVWDLMDLLILPLTDLLESEESI